MNEDYYFTVLAKIGENDFTEAVSFSGSADIWETEFSIESLAQTAEKAVIGAGANSGEYTVDLYVNAKNLSDPLNIVITEKDTGKVCLNLTDRVDAIAASYPESNDNYDMAPQLLVYIQAAVHYANA